MVSYFDTYEGPKLARVVPEALGGSVEGVVQLLDLQDEGFFAHTIHDLRSYNYAIQLPRARARGNFDKVQVSLLTRGTVLSLATAREIVAYLTRRFQRLPSVQDGKRRIQQLKEPPSGDDELGEFLDEYLAAIRPTIMALEEVETQKRDLARFPDQDPNPVFRVSRTGHLLYANAASERVIPTRAADITASETETRPPPGFGSGWGDLPAGWKEPITDALETGTTREFEVPVAGHVYVFTCSPVPERQYVNLYGRDVTETRAAEANLRAAYHQLAQVFENTVEGIRIVDRDFTTTRVNRAFLELVGRPETEVVGKKCHEAFPGRMCRTDRCVLQQIVAGAPVVEGEDVKVTARGEEITCRVRAVPLQDARGQVIGIVENFRRARPPRDPPAPPAKG